MSNPTGGKILLVDDDEAILFALADYFTHRGIDVDCASDKDEAARLSNTTTYRAAIVDLCLNGFDQTDGLGLVRSLASRFPMTPVLVLTSNGSREVEKVARASGADFFFHKPTGLGELAHVILAILEAQQ